MLPTRTKNTHTHRHTDTHKGEDLILMLLHLSKFWLATYLASGRNVYLCRFGIRVQRDEEDLHDTLLADRKWHAQVAEGVEGHRHLVALGTDERGLEETMKRVDDH